VLLSSLCIPPVIQIYPLCRIGQGEKATTGVYVII
jgi:hypothetical protein